MDMWKINLKFSDGTVNELDLYDAKGYFNGYLKLKRTYFLRLVKAIKMTKKYTLRSPVLRPGAGPSGRPRLPAAPTGWRSGKGRRATAWLSDRSCPFRETAHGLKTPPSPGG